MDIFGFSDGFLKDYRQYIGIEVFRRYVDSEILARGSHS